MNSIGGLQIQMKTINGFSPETPMNSTGGDSGEFYWWIADPNENYKWILTRDSDEFYWWITDPNEIGYK